MAIVSKGNKGGYTTARFTASGVVFPNNSGADGANSAGEIVNTMTIAQVKWSTVGATDSWTIIRGANTVLTLGGHGHWDFAGDGTQIELGGEAAANTVVTLSGSGSLVLKFHKQSQFS